MTFNARTHMKVASKKVPAEKNGVKKTNTLENLRFTPMKLKLMKRSRRKIKICLTKARSKITLTLTT
jgi:hypothetical protein